MRKTSRPRIRCRRASPSWRRRAVRKTPPAFPFARWARFPPETSKSYEIRVRVDSSMPDRATITNTVTGHSDTPDPIPDPHSNTGSSTTTIDTQADLEVTKTDTPDPVLAGATLTYTITVVNHGPSDAQNVRATDTLPPGVTFLATQGCAEDPAGVPVCTLGTIPARDVQVVRVRVRVDSSMPDGATITNTVTGHSDTPDPIPDPHSNTGSSTTTIDTQADLEVTKADTPDPVLAGRTLTYTVTVHNHGPSDAQNVRATDTLPPGVTFLATQGWRTDPDGVPVCTLGTIPAETSKSYEIRVRVDSSMPDGATITNTVTGHSDTPEPVPDPHSNTGSSTTTIDTPADLEVTKTGTPDPVLAGRTLTYTVTVQITVPAMRKTSKLRIRCRRASPSWRRKAAGKTPPAFPFARWGRFLPRRPSRTRSASGSIRACRTAPRSPTR